jgi:hypothetical protein
MHVEAAEQEELSEELFLFAWSMPEFVCDIDPKDSVEDAHGTDPTPIGQTLCFRMAPYSVQEYTEA